MNWRDALFRIHSTDKQKPVFGNGFVCARVCDEPYRPAGHHVIKDLAEDNAQILNEFIGICNLSRLEQKITACFPPKPHETIVVHRRFR